MAPRYTPPDEARLLAQTDRIRVIDYPNERLVEVRILVPYNVPEPHDAKAPT